MKEIEIKDEPRKPLNLGTMTTVDMETGEVVDRKPNAGVLLPPPPDKCQVCAVDHKLDQPHNKDSIYYQMAFHATHGRWPTWADAMAHCPPEVRERWRTMLIREYQKRGMDAPELAS